MDCNISLTGLHEILKSNATVPYLTPNPPEGLSYLDGVLPLGEVDVLLLLLLGLEGSLVLGQTTTDGAGLLGAKVKRHVLLGLVEKTKLLALLGVDDGQSASNGLADVVATAQSASNSFLPIPRISGVLIRDKNGFGVHLGELGVVSTDDLLDAEVGELVLELVNLLDEVLLGLGPQLGGFNSGLSVRVRVSTFLSQFPL